MRTRILPLLVVLAAGCESDAPEQKPTPPPSPPIGTAHDPARTGTITGRVTWQGPIPKVSEFSYMILHPEGRIENRPVPNPNRPRIHADTRAVAGVVVYLQDVDPAVARPWDLPAVSVEIGNGKISVVQGDRRGRVGFVRQGDSVSVSSSEAVYHLLRGRGASYFGLALPEPNKPVTRKLDEAGRVELSSGTGQFWMRGELFVANHPYFAVTDAEGRFKLERVPAGSTKLVACMPSWEVADTERDPDLTLVVRVTYKPSIERIAPLEVTTGQTAEMNISVP